MPNISPAEDQLNASSARRELGAFSPFKAQGIPAKLNRAGTTHTVKRASSQRNVLMEHMRMDSIFQLLLTVPIVRRVNIAQGAK